MLAGKLPQANRATTGQWMLRAKAVHQALPPVLVAAA